MTDAPGFHGKSPALGDFLSRRLPPGFGAAWDTWLGGVVEASRARFGADWLALWLEAPVWHFALGAGVAGPARAFGVLIPSVDRVGRHFPFTVLGLARPGATPLPLWAVRAEALALSALEDGFDPARLDAELTRLGSPDDPPSDPRPAAGVTPLDAPGDWPEAADAAVAALAPGQTLWWCRGAARVPAVLLRCPGLPDEAASAGLVAWPDALRPGVLGHDLDGLDA
jgi:type VI secretion system protein ImpM